MRIPIFALILLAAVMAACSGAPETPEPTAPAASAPTPISTQAPTPTPTPDTGLCGVSPELRQTLLDILGQHCCGEVRPEELAAVTDLSIRQEDLESGALERLGMNGITGLTVTGVTRPLSEPALRFHSRVKTLVVITGSEEEADETGTAETRSVIPTGILKELPELEKLVLTGVDGRRENTLEPGILDGTERLRDFRMDYLVGIEPDALSQAPSLEMVRLHGSERRGDFPPRIPPEIFGELPLLRSVEIKNFRWPPVLQLKNLETACRARSWRSFNEAGDTVGKKPLGFILPGEYQQPRDLESLEGCGGERPG